MQVSVKRGSSWKRNSAWGLLLVGGSVLERITSYGRQFTIQQVYQRWEFIGCILAVLIIAIYAVFLRSFERRLRLQEKILLGLVAIVALASWTAFYIFADPPTRMVLGNMVLFQWLSLVVAIAVSLGFIFMLGHFVERRHHPDGEMSIGIAASK